jgi:hypothetical protein
MPVETPLANASSSFHARGTEIVSQDASLNAVAWAPVTSPLLSFHPMSRFNFTRLLAGTVYAADEIDAAAMIAVKKTAKTFLLNIYLSFV